MKDGLRFLGNLPPPNHGYDILDKEQGVAQYVTYMLDRTNRIFEYDNLPNTIPAYMLELMLQCYGCVCFTTANPRFKQEQLTSPNISVTLDTMQDTVEGDPANSSSTSEYVGPDNLYVFRGELGGPPDIYYQPTLCIVANPVLSESLNLTIGKDCVIMRNDMMMNGLLPMFSRYASQMVENDISVRSAQINSRQAAIISASTDAEMASAEMYATRLVEGKIAIIAETPFVEGIKVQNAKVQSSNSIIQLIELQQYLKASWFNEIGLNSSYNMKREYLSEEEIALSTDALLPLIDEMFYCRKIACQRINDLYGTNIDVRKGSAWADKNREVQTSLGKKDAEIASLTSEAEENKEGGEQNES